MLHSRHNALSEDEIIEQADKLFGFGREADVPDLLCALEAFYFDGSADEQSGDVETFGHFYRVHRWIVWTDSQGFHDVETYDNEEQATKAFDEYTKEYAATFEEADV